MSDFARDAQAGAARAPCWQNLRARYSAFASDDDETTRRHRARSTS